jgi:hypothetical protein
MKPLFVIGLILILLGAAALIYGGVTYYTKKDVVDFAGVKIQTEQKKQVPLSPVFGGVGVVAGVVLVIAGRLGSSRRATI